MKINDRVKLINPGGYNNYQGTVEEFLIGNFVRVKWDMPYFPCTSPIEKKWLKLINKRNIKKSLVT